MADEDAAEEHEESGTFDLAKLDVGMAEHAIAAEMETVRRATSGILGVFSGGAFDDAARAASGFRARHHAEPDVIGSALRHAEQSGVLSGARMRSTGVTGRYSTDLEGQRTAITSFGPSTAGILGGPMPDRMARDLVEANRRLFAPVSVGTIAEEEFAAMREAHRLASGQIGSRQDWPRPSILASLDAMYEASGVGADRDKLLGYAGLVGSLSTIASEMQAFRNMTSGQASAVLRDMQRQVEAGSSAAIIERAMRASHPAIFPPMRAPRASEISAVIDGVLADLSPYPDWAAETRSRFDALPSPWIRQDQPDASVMAMTRLAALQLAVRVQDPPSQELNEALRSRLGDYDTDEEGAADRTADPIARTEYVLERGFDPVLTILPTAVVSSMFAPFRSGQVAEPPIDPDQLENMVRMMLKRIELGIRRFLAAKLHEMYGERWFDHLPSALRAGWTRARQRDIEAGRKPADLIAYADIEDYVKIIDHPERWPSLFEPVFRDVNQIRASLRRIAAIRNPGAHFRPVTTEDLIVLSAEGVHLSRWFGFRLEG